MKKTHEERVQACISRLQEVSLLDPTRSDTALKFKEFFDKTPDPEAITKNLLFMHSKKFNFNDSEVLKELLNGGIDALKYRELFFKKGFELKMDYFIPRESTALKKFFNAHINKDQSSAIYFGLQVLESNDCFSTAEEPVSAELKELAVDLLDDLGLMSHRYLIREGGESSDEKSIDLLPERVAANFAALRKEGYVGIFAKFRINVGLSEQMIRVLANPANEKELGRLAMDLGFLSIAALSGTISNRRSGFGQTILSNNLQNIGSSVNFIDSWKRVLNKMKFLDLVAKDDNDQLIAFLRDKAVNLTPDTLRAAYLRLPQTPSSEFNRKLLLLQQGELEKTEIALGIDATTVDPSARNIQMAIRSNQAFSVEVNWVEALCEIPLENFSSETIAQRTCLTAVSKLQPLEARKALGLEKLDESQQATLIHELQKNNLKISGELNYLSGLLKSASATQGALLIDYFLTDINKNYFATSVLKNLVILTQFVRINSKAIKNEVRDRVEFVIQQSMQKCIPSINDSWYLKAKDSDQIRQAWKNARGTSEKTEAEKVYRSVQKARESKPINVKAVSQILSDYMTKNPATDFSIELKKNFGDFFLQNTPSSAVAVQMKTPAAGASGYKT